MVHLVVETAHIMQQPAGLVVAVVVPPGMLRVQTAFPARGAEVVIHPARAGITHREAAGEPVLEEVMAMECTVETVVQEENHP
jgi:hypothetical protein